MEVSNGRVAPRQSAGSIPAVSDALRSSSQPYALIVYDFSSPIQGISFQFLSEREVSCIAEIGGHIGDCYDWFLAKWY